MRRQHTDDGQAGTRHLAPGNRQPEGEDPGRAGEGAVVVHPVHALERHDPPEPFYLLVGGLPPEVVPDRTQRNAELVEIAHGPDAVGHAAILSTAVPDMATASLGGVTGRRYSFCSGA